MSIVWARIGVTGSFVLLMFCISMNFYAEGRKRIRTYEEYLKGVYQKTKKRSFYIRKRDWLRHMGASFHFGKWFSAEAYWLLKCLLFVTTFLTVSRIAWGYGCLAALFMWIGIDLLIEALNKSDNRRMLQDLKLIFRSMDIQTKAGVHIPDALSELYGSVQEKRLQEALLNLSGEMVMEGNVYEALMHFREKFENAQIDSMCMIVLQALETGQAASMLREMENQVKDMEALILAEQKQKMDRSITFYQLGILGCMLAIVIYSCVAGMFQAAWFL